jgi:hypothetical protein
VFRYARVFTAKETNAGDTIRYVATSKIIFHTVAWRDGCVVPLKKTDVKEPPSIKVCISYSVVIKYTKKIIYWSLHCTALHCMLQIQLIHRRNMYFIIDDKETKFCVLAHSGKFLNSLFYMLISILRFRGTTILTRLKISLNVKKFPLWKKDLSGV